MKIWFRFALILCLGIAVSLSGCGGGSTSGSTGGGGGGGGSTTTPTVTSISPTSVTAGSGALTLTVSGTGFLNSTTVQVGGVAEQTTYLSSTQVTAAIPASQVASGSQLAVVALNGSPSSGSGTPVSLQVNNPAPTIATVAPTTVLAGASSPEVTVTGTGFVPTTQIQVSGSVRATTFTSSTQVTVTLTAADVAASGSLSLTAVNSTPGGGTSTAATVTVSAIVLTPSVTSISPAAVTAGSGAFTLTVNGTGFLNTTVVEVGSVAEQTTYLSSTQLTAAIPASQVTSGAQLAVIALNGSVSSAPVNLVVNNPAPTVTTVAPTTVQAGSASPVLTVTGTGFVPTTQVQVNGNARTTVLISSTQVSVTLMAADVAAAGNLSLIAMNGAPGGGTSTVAAIAVNNPVPTLLNVIPVVVLTNSGPITATVVGTNFVPTSTIQLNGTAVTTTYVSPRQLTFSLPNQPTVRANTLTITNPAPGGGTSPSFNFFALAPTGAPTITSVGPTQFTAGSGTTTISVFGTNFFQTPGGAFVITGLVQWNGTILETFGARTVSGTTQSVEAQVPASLLTTAGTATITVVSSVATPSTSNTVTVTIGNPSVPTLSSLAPSIGPVDTTTPVTLNGAGFAPSSVVTLNGTNLLTTYEASNELAVTSPALAIQFPGNVNLAVTTPAPGGGTSVSLPYTAAVILTNNDIAYSPTDGLIYASVPATATAMANCVVGVDPETGNVVRQIWVGSNPNKLAISTDGTQLFVGLDGAGAIVQINLTNGQIVNEFSLGPGLGIENPPSTALYLAAVPGAPNSVAVEMGSGSSAGLAIYDAGVMRSKNLTTLNQSWPMSFGASASTLYLMIDVGVYQYTVDATGVYGQTLLSSGTFTIAANSSLQYDSGRLYLSDGTVIDATSGSVVGTFVASGTTAATGPIVSDSGLGLAFVGFQPNVGSNAEVLAFNESSFASTGSIAVGGNFSTEPYAFHKIIRWGQNGLAMNSPAQIYLLQSPVVKDLSSSPADLAVSLGVPPTTNTGNTTTYTATIQNQGPNAALGASLAVTLDPSYIINSITPSQGTCGSSNAFLCDFGGLANGASVTVTVNVTPTIAGTFPVSATLNSVSFDPTSTNNQASASTVVTGSIYAMVPAVSSISPNLVPAGSGAFTLTVNGSGFNANSTVNIGETAMPTTFVNSTQLTTDVSANILANYGWAPVTVSNAAPGGGTSAVVPLTIYAALNVPANYIAFDPFSQQIYASIPGTATNITNNSIVTINPYTAAVGTPTPIGNQPTYMAETSDGNYLFVSLSGSNSLAQFDLVHQIVTAIVPVPSTPFGSSTIVTPGYLAAMPGSDSTVAMNLIVTPNPSLPSSSDGYGIFDISGNTGSFRPNLMSNFQTVNPVFADATDIYAYNPQGTAGEFYRYNVNSNGFTLIDSTTVDGLGESGGSVALAGGLVYGEGGGIINPSMTPPSQVAILHLILDVTETNRAAVGILSESATQKEFLLLQSAINPYTYALARYDTTNYLPDTWLSFPSNLIYFANVTMARWGQDGIAFAANVIDTTANQQGNVVFILRGPFVIPQELSTSTAARLSSAPALTHGAGNTMLTLTGTNFLPGVAVTWNGSYRTTTIVDASNVRVAIPANDLISAGSASLVATNPGATASSTLTITIN